MSDNDSDGMDNSNEDIIIIGERVMSSYTTS